MTSGKPEGGNYYTLDEWLQVLQDNIVSCEDCIARLDEQITEAAGIDKIKGRFANRTFNTFRKDLQPKAYDTSVAVANAIVDGEPTNLFLTGGTGTGKTHLAVALTHYVADRGIAVKFGNITDLLHGIKQSFQGDSDEIDNIKNAPVLVIDDLGKETDTAWVTETIYTIINYRYENMLPTVVTTNLSMKELQKRLGEATISRLKEMCKDTYVNMDGEDYRLE